MSDRELIRRIVCTLNSWLKSLSKLECVSEEQETVVQTWYQSLQRLNSEICEEMKNNEERS